MSLLSPDREWAPAEHRQWWATWSVLGWGGREVCFLGGLQPDPGPVEASQDQECDGYLLG